MQNHKYNGQLICCLTCFRPQSDPIHLPDVTITNHHAIEPLSIDQSNLISNNDIALYNDPSLPAVEVRAAALEENIADFEILKPCDEDSDPGECPADYFDTVELLDKQSEATLTQSITACNGHTCPDCKQIWTHTYDCCNRQQSGLCEKCCGNAAVEISRPSAIEQIAQISSKNLTGREVSEMLIEHEPLVWSLIYYTDASGKECEYADWQEKVHAHIRDCERKAEAFRAKALNASRITLEKHKKDVEKLTPEERAQYKRDAAKSAAGKSIKDRDKGTQTEKKQTAEESYKKMLKALADDIRVRKPHMKDEDVIKLAEKKYQIQKEMDGV